MSERGPQKRGDARRDLLAAAALAVLDDQGIGALTHRAVAERAGVPAPSLAYYFPTKESLVEAALDRMVDRELEQFSALADALGPSDESSEQLGAILAQALESLVRDARESQLAQFEVLVHVARGGAEDGAAARWLRAYDQLAERLLALVGVPEPRTAASVAVPAAFGLVLRQLADPLDEDALRAACVRLIDSLRRSG
jgi:AcrR family transcriptional regulator